MYSSVNLFASDTSTLAPLPGAVFKVLSTDNTAVVGVYTANALGVAEVLLPVGEFEVRVFHFGSSFGGAKRISVVGPTDSFDFRGLRHHAQDSLDPRLCVAHGYFRHGDGRPFRNLDIHVKPMFSPILVDGAAVMAEPTIVRTNDDGWVRVSFVRGTTYCVELEGYDPGSRTVYIPDAAQWNLPDIVFPQVVGLELETAVPPLQLVVGADLVVAASIAVSDGRRLPCTTPEVQWSVTDTAKVYFEARETGFFLRGLEPGASQLKLERGPNSIYAIPYREVLLSPVNIEVT